MGEACLRHTIQSRKHRFNLRLPGISWCFAVFLTTSRYAEGAGQPVTYHKKNTCKFPT